MNINSQSLASLETKYNGYLEGSLVDELIKEFGINFAAGHWCAGEFFDRFCPVGYSSNDPNFKDTIPDQIERVSRAGIQGIEFHERCFIDSNYALDQAAFDSIATALKTHNVTPTNMNMNTWTDPKWKFGGVTHPDAGIRKDCVNLCLQGIEIAKKIGCVSGNLWPGSDGWDYHFEVDYGKRLSWYIDGCTEIAERADSLGLKFGTEPKQKSPAKAI